MRFKNFYYNHIQKCNFFLKNKRHIFLEFFYDKFFYDKFFYLPSQNSELVIHHYAFINFQHLNFSMNFLLDENAKNFFSEKKILFANNWIFDYKIFTFFLEQKKNNLHMIQKKKIYCIYSCIHSNIRFLKITTYNFVYFFNTFSDYIVEMIYSVFNSFCKTVLQNELRVYNNIQNTLNKFSSANATDVSSNVLASNADISGLKNFILEIFERNVTSSFFSIFYGIVLYLNLKNIEKKKYFYFFGLLYLNFQDKNRFEKIKSREKFYKEECKLDFSINNYTKKNLLVNIFKTKKLFEMYSFFSNLMNRLTFCFLKFLIYKIIANFLYKIEKLFDNNTIGLICYLLNKKLSSVFNAKKSKNIFLKISRKIKSFERESVGMKTYLAVIRILKNYSIYSRNKNLTSI